MKTADDLIPSSASSVKQHPRAVHALQCSYDSPIPVEEVLRAKAIDAAWEAANPDWYSEQARATRNVRMAREGMTCEISDFRASLGKPWFDQTQRQFRYKKMAQIMASFRHWNAISRGRAVEAV